MNYKGKVSGASSTGDKRKKTISAALTALKPRQSQGKAKTDVRPEVRAPSSTLSMTVPSKSRVAKSNKESRVSQSDERRIRAAIAPRSQRAKAARGNAPVVKSDAQRAKDIRKIIGKSEVKGVTARLGKQAMDKRTRVPGGSSIAQNSKPSTATKARQAAEKRQSSALSRSSFSKARSRR